MAYIITNMGEQRILSGGLCRVGSPLMTAGLVMSAYELTATMTLTSVTIFSAGRAGNGLCTAQLSATGWCAPFLSAGYATISATGEGLRFAFTAAPNKSAVGYALYDDTNMFILETFSDGPYYLSNAGDTVTVTPYVKLGSGSGN